MAIRNGFGLLLDYVGAYLIMYAANHDVLKI